MAHSWSHLSQNLNIRKSSWRYHFNQLSICKSLWLLKCSKIWTFSRKSLVLAFFFLCLLLSHNLHFVFLIISNTWVLMAWKRFYFFLFKYFSSLSNLNSPMNYFSVFLLFQVIMRWSNAVLLLGLRIKILCRQIYHFVQTLLLYCVWSTM